MTSGGSSRTSTACIVRCSRSGAARAGNRTSTAGYGIILLWSVRCTIRLEKPLDHHGAFVFHTKTCHVRPVLPGDIETLRLWKNENRTAFHHQAIITPEQQSRWFAAFAADPTQQLFVCEIDGELVACVGFRVKTATRVELFNLICGHGAYLGGGLTTQFFEFMRDALAAKGYTEIELDVLKSNVRAASWYARRGFRTAGGGETFERLLLTQ
jgi:ribosomal protein S18 acetylase RimI-like enzyme